MHAIITGRAKSPPTWY